MIITLVGTSGWFPTHISATQRRGARGSSSPSGGSPSLRTARRREGEACGRPGRYESSMAEPARCFHVFELQSRRNSIPRQVANTFLSLPSRHICANTTAVRGTTSTMG